MENEKEALEHFRKIIKDIKVAMLTTIDEDGQLRSRPMATQQCEFDGQTLWFFTSYDSPKSREVEDHHQVNAVYSAPQDNCFLSVSGKGALVRDRVKIKELWSPLHRAWFPDGVDDPDLVLLKVDVEKAEYWDTPSGTMVQLIGFIKAVSTGQSLNKIGDHKKLNFENGGAIV